MFGGPIPCDEFELEEAIDEVFGLDEVEELYCRCEHIQGEDKQSHFNGWSADIDGPDGKQFQTGGFETKEALLSALDYCGVADSQIEFHE
jgi:hypothetical protein